MQQAFHRQKKICPSPAVTHLKTLSIFQGVYTEAQSRGVTGVLAAQLSPRCFRGDPPSASFGHVPICLFVGLSAFRGAVTILTWTHFHECQQPVLFLILGSSQVATGAKRRSFFFFFLWELIPVPAEEQSRVNGLSRACSWKPCLALLWFWAGTQSYPQGFCFSVCKTRVNSSPGWPQSRPDQEACRPP